MTLTLHHIPDWGSSIILLALEEIGQPYQIAAMDWDAGDFDSAAFRAVNPLGLIPAMTTPDGPIFETAAILLWLNERFGGLGPREGEADRTAFLSWLLFVSNTLHPTVIALVYPERTAGEALAAPVRLHAAQRLHEHAAQLEAMIAAKAPDWLSTRKGGAVGYYLAIMLRWAIYLPADPECRFSLEAYPALRAVLAAHETFPAARRVIAADGLGPHPFTAPKATQ